VGGDEGFEGEWLIHFLSHVREFERNSRWAKGIDVSGLCV